MTSKADFYEKLHTEHSEPWDYSSRAAELLRYEWVSDLVAQCDPHNEGVLDVGCSLGQLSELLVSKGRLVSGIDISAVAVEKVKAKMSFSGKGGEFKQGQADQIPFADSAFKMVLLCDGVAEWEYSPAGKQKVLKEVYRVLKPGGYALFTDFTKPRLFKNYIDELKSDLFSFEKVHYFNDRLWFQLATNLKSLNDQTWCRSLLKNRGLAQALAQVSKVFGPAGSKHIGVLLKKA